MLKYKDIIYSVHLKRFYQVVNTGKKSYTVKDLQNDDISKEHKSSCDKLVEQKVWIVGDRTTMSLLYGK